MKKHACSCATAKNGTDNEKMDLYVNSLLSFTDKAEYCERRVDDFERLFESGYIPTMQHLSLILFRTFTMDRKNYIIADMFLKDFGYPKDMKDDSYIKMVIQLVKEDEYLKNKLEKIGFQIY